MATGGRFRLGGRLRGSVFLLSLFRAASSLSLVIAYQNIASGMASTIHFMYPLVVALAMMCFFRERGSVWTFAAVGLSIVGAVLLSQGNAGFARGNTTLGIVSSVVSVVAYGGYIVGVRKSRAVEIDSSVLTCYVMAFGALMFIVGGCFTGGIRLETDPHTWLYILGIALPATAVSNMALVRAIKCIGPTLTSILGAMEPLTAVLVGVVHFGERFDLDAAAGLILVITAVIIVILQTHHTPPAPPADIPTQPQE